MYPTLMEIKELIPYIVSILGTAIILKKDWIASKFTKKEKVLNVLLAEEDIEAKSLENVEKTLIIYRDIVEDLKNTIGELKAEISELKEEVRELKDFIQEQKEFIKKQSSSLQYYETKYGKIKE